MKTIQLLILLLGLCTAPVVMTGCKATPQQIAFNTTEGVVKSVDIAMREWYRYLVAEERRVAALTPIDQGSQRADLIRKDGRVREAYGRYQAAMAGVEVAAMGAGQIPPDASQAAAALLNITKELQK
jgi:hypothetical protein